MSRLGLSLIFNYTMMAAMMGVAILVMRHVYTIENLCFQSCFAWR